MQSSGLRARSKVKRREAILAAGLQLFAERGYAGTTLADIAKAADVAPRTVSLYFPSKLDIALSYTNASCERMADALDGRAPGESFIEVIDRFLDEEEQHEDTGRQRLVAEMLAANPSLPGLRTPSVERVFRSARAVLAADLRLPEDDYATQIAVTSMIGVLAVYASTAARAEEPLERKRKTLTFLAAGLNAVRG
jgi:AcrR family transcriptional regulator